jgi:hypothetical protein
MLWGVALVALVVALPVMLVGFNLAQDTALERCTTIPPESPASLRQAGTTITVSWGITGYTCEYRRGGRLIYKEVRRDFW